MYGADVATTSMWKITNYSINKKKALWKERNVVKKKKLHYLLFITLNYYAFDFIQSLID